MKAVWRVWWTFLTAVALQRVLCLVGVVLLGIGVAAWLPSQNPRWLPLGFLMFVLLVGTPALFSAPALFRMLSAPRMHQLLPHFRVRMLMAASLLIGTLLVAAFAVAIAPALATGRPLPLSALGYPPAALIALFLLLFLTFGDWRWSALAPLVFVVLVRIRELSPAAAAMLAAPPAWVWSAVALASWAWFAVWYLRVREVRGLMLMPQRRAGVDASRPVPRTVAIRALLVSLPSRVAMQQVGPRNAPFLFVALLIIMILIAQGLRSLSLTMVFWPLGLMLVFAERSVAVVRQSRLLWLRIPGGRDDVRRQVEQVLWRNLALGCAGLAFIAAVAASPLVGQGIAEVGLGFAMSAAAGTYATYVAMAAVPSLATYILGFGSMALFQIGALVFSNHSLKAVAVVAAVELVAAALLRALAVRRWRAVDWLRLKPLASLAGTPRSPWTEASTG